MDVLQHNPPKSGHRRVTAACPFWADTVEKGLVIFGEQ
jgi:hypothetical protein